MENFKGISLENVGFSGDRQRVPSRPRYRPLTPMPGLKVEWSKGFEFDKIAIAELYQDDKGRSKPSVSVKTVSQTYIVRS